MKCITFLSDFGLKDGYVSACKGVIKKISPGVEIIDITHQIKNFNLKEAAFILLSVLPYMPVGIHLVVVDPGVGGPRKNIIVETGRGDYLIGPDNGIFPTVAPIIGGILRVFEITNEKYFLKKVSSTFHGRDIFSPLAARLARGESPEEFGEQLIKLDLKGVLWEEPFIKEGSIFGEIIYIDKFGTACFNLKESEVKELGFKAGGYINLFINKTKKRVKYEKVFSSVSPGRALLFIDSSGYLALGVNKGSAWKEFGLKIGENVVFKQNEV